MFRSVHRGRRLPSQVIQLHRRAASSTAVARLPGTLVSSEWLKQNLVGVKVVDGSWHMPAEKRNPHKDFLSQRIPTARFFDVDAISDRSTDLPHMLPSNEEFADAVGRGLGISDTDSIVVYDTKGVFRCAPCQFPLTACVDDLLCSCCLICVCAWACAQRAARGLDVQAIRRKERGGAGRRPARVAARKARDGQRRAQTSQAGHLPRQTGHVSAASRCATLLPTVSLVRVLASVSRRWRKCATTSPASVPRCVRFLPFIALNRELTVARHGRLLTLVRAVASPARIPSRGRAFAEATSRSRSTCPLARSSRRDRPLVVRSIDLSHNIVLTLYPLLTVRFKQPAEIKKVFTDAGIDYSDPDRPLVGITQRAKLFLLILRVFRSPAAVRA